MITAKYLHENSGSEYDRENILKFGFSLGQEFEVESIYVYPFYTEIYLKGYESSFNSVNFEIYEDGEELDYTQNKRFTSHF